MLRKSKGSITVFLAVVFMSLILLTGAFIDIANIMAANILLDRSLHSALRSVMAGYDESLAGEYGLFALDMGSNPERLKEELLRYASVNMKGRSHGIQLSEVHLEVNSLNLTGSQNMKDTAVLKKQIVDYMSIKGPLIMAENIIDKIKGAKLEGKLKHAQAEAITRQKSLQVRNKVGMLKERLKGIENKVRSLSVSDFAGLIADLEAASMDSRRLYEEEHREYMEAQKQLESISKETGYLPSSFEDVRSTVLQIKEIEASMQELINRAKEVQASIQTLEEELSGLEQRKHALLQMPDKQRNIQELAYIEGGLDSIEREIAKSRSSLNLASIMEQLARCSEFVQQPIEMPTVDKQFHTGFQGKLKVMQQNLGVNRVEGLYSTQQEELNHYLPLDPRAMSTLGEELHNSEQKSGEALDIIADISRLVSSSAISLTDRLYLNEYIMDKFTFLTSKTKRQHLLKKGEIEYILCADPTSGSTATEWGCILNAVSRIWLVRLSVNFLDAFATSKVAEPFARMLWAIAEGAVDASKDMLDMLGGTPVGICPSLPHVKLKYSDHLRLLLLMREEDKLLKNMQSLMQANTRSIEGAYKTKDKRSFRLANCNTHIELNCTGKVRLVFLPLLLVDKVGLSSIKDGFYWIDKKILKHY